ncbi:uncharacterized protein LOC129743235 [Uranotaenia lowii]|uniref:uncharacterized protein LOC129743235 n=1 Tax=Uranotaenia lowii TaxID=190385 RepID=UPI00247A4A2C|nr:uncharacterized protein LOC129743235 [Uranotaenia lowii]
MIDERLSFKNHVEYVCRKAATATAALSRIMANNSGIRSSQRRVISSVVSSIFRYGGAAWKSGLNIQCNQQKLSSVQSRMNLRVISAYCTVSSKDACVVEEVMLVSVLLVEDSYRYKNKGTQSQGWPWPWPTDSSCGTAQKEEEHQGKYHHRFGHVASLVWLTCGEAGEAPEHVVFYCPKFEEKRACGLDTTADDMLQKMCDDINTCHVVCDGLVRIMTDLQRSWTSTRINQLFQKL